jgi:hypothetical protein
MSLQHEFSYPKVTEIRPTLPSVPRRRVRRSTQRELVVASLLRCPEDRSSTEGRKLR